ncbi:Phage virion morphogenesis protein [Azospirillaceae bacterium]
MRVLLTLDGVADDLRREADVLVAAATRGVAEATENLAGALRNQVVSAGLGERLARTWKHGMDAPKGNVISGAVWSKAPLIIQGFDEGATIVARNGSRWLAIPTDNVPPRERGAKAPGAHPRSKMTPVEVEANFNHDLRLVPSPSGASAYLVMDDLISARSGRGFRSTTPRRLAQGREARSILMFVLVPQVTLSKRLDVAGAIARIEQDFPNMILALQLRFLQVGALCRCLMCSSPQ